MILLSPAGFHCRSVIALFSAFYGALREVVFMFWMDAVLEVEREIVCRW